MFTQENLEKLIEHIDDIISYTEEKGFANIKLINPLRLSQKENLHFMVTVKDKNVSLFDKAQLTNKLKKFLNCEDIIVITENQFDPETKAELIDEKSAVLLAKNKINNLRALFEILLANIKLENEFLPIKPV